MQNKHYAEYCLDINAEPIELAIALTKQDFADDYVVYESGSEWSIAIG